jgi:hypothetical protein
MAFHIATDRPRGFESREDAERVIEIAGPAGYLYEVAELRFDGLPIMFAVKVYAEDGAWLGYGQLLDES